MDVKKFFKDKKKLLAAAAVFLSAVVVLSVILKISVGNKKPQSGKKTTGTASVSKKDVKFEHGEMCESPSFSDEKESLAEFTTEETTTQTTAVPTVPPPAPAPVTPSYPEGPIFVTASTVTVKVGSEKIPDPMICIDDKDKKIIPTVEGYYNLNAVGRYKLTRVARDSDGHVTRFPFVLNVVSELPETSAPEPSPKFNFSDAVARYKNDKTAIGIDVSKWQGDIDWKKVKNAGCEFVFIRIGVQNGFGGESKTDTYFIDNYKGAKAAGLKVGVYYYTYATDKKEAKEQAKFVLDTLSENSCKLDLPIAYDWESWNKLGGLEMSINDLNACAEAFLSTVEKAGYNGMLYSSKYYLEKTLWRLDTTKYPVWLAHYVSQTSYAGSYSVWQCSCTGKIPGIKGDVDINVLYY